MLVDSYVTGDLILKVVVGADLRCKPSASLEGGDSVRNKQVMDEVGLCK